MDFFLRRRIRKINLFLILAAAAGAASLALSLIRTQAEYHPPETAAAPSPEYGEPEARPASHYSAIAEKNLFGISRPAEPERPAPPPAPPAPRVPELKLIGTVLFSSGGGFAIIKDGSSGAEETVRKGQEISGMELVSLEWDRAVFKGERGELAIQIDPAAVAAPAPAPRPSPGDAGASRISERFRQRDASSRPPGTDSGPPSSRPRGVPSAPPGAGSPGPEGAPFLAPEGP